MGKNTINEIVFHTCLLLVKHFRMMIENDRGIHTRLFSHIFFATRILCLYSFVYFIFSPRMI